jgi:hypothetical protein
MLHPDLAARLAVYCAATGHTEDQAMARVLEIGLTTWETEPHYMPERVCGRVRTAIHHASHQCRSAG